MKDPLTIDGRWHVHGEELPAHYGQLICEPSQRLRLEIKEICDSTFDEAMSAEDKDQSQPLTIQGYDPHNRPLRLYGCVINEIRRQMGMRSYVFFVQRAVTNLAAGAWTDIRSRNFQLRFAMLHSWMHRQISVRDDTSRVADIRVEVREGLVIILGAVTHSHTSWEQSRFEINHDSWLGLEFAEDQPVWHVRSEVIKALTLFFTLLTGDPVTLDGFIFLPSGVVEIGLEVVEHHLLERRGFATAAKVNKEWWTMRATYPEVSGHLADMLRRWFALFESPDMRAVLELYAAFTYTRLYGAAQFLILAQALEAYHTACGRFSGLLMAKTDFSALKRRAKEALSDADYSQLAERFIFANQKTFSTKLVEVISSAPEYARSLIPDALAFASIVKDLRNAYTHHVGGAAQTARRNHDRSIPRLTRQAHGLLEMLLLAEMGAPDVVYQKIAREHVTSISIDLSDEEV